MEVLIIHRQDHFLKKVRERFLSGGWHATTSQSGLDGLMIARHQRFDLILCGFDLPVISGTELVRSLRMLSLNRATPVFLLTEGKASDWQEEVATRLEAHTITLDEVESGTGSIASLSHLN